MRVETYLKLGQIVGVLVMSAGVVAVMDRLSFDVSTGPRLLLIGGLIYAGCRIALWLREK